MIDMVACVIASVTGFFLIDVVNKVQAWKIQVYESANCTNLQPVTLWASKTKWDQGMYWPKVGFELPRDRVQIDQH